MDWAGRNRIQTLRRYRDTKWWNRIKHMPIHVRKLFGWVRGRAGIPPRQWEDPTRLWLREEMERSASMLTAAGICCWKRLYFGGEEPSLAQHFGCVASFELGPVPHRADRL